MVWHCLLRARLGDLQISLITPLLNPRLPNNPKIYIIPLVFRVSMSGRRRLLTTSDPYAGLPAIKKKIFFKNSYNHVRDNIDTRSLQCVYTNRQNNRLVIVNKLPGHELIYM